MVIIFTFFIISCKNNSDYRKFIITNFTKRRIDSLKPVANKSYYSFYVKGYTNDTVKIRGIYQMNLSGKIDTIINGNYYGTHNVVCLFDPYKASKGKLEIEYSL